MDPALDFVPPGVSVSALAAPPIPIAAHRRGDASRATLEWHEGR
jgi:hypothetical protein